MRTQSYEYLYDLAGNAITLLNAANGGWAFGEVYAAGRHIATYSGGTTNFNHSDWLGTERARSSTGGNTSETCTSLPFGDSLTCAGTDWSARHFTGQEHDSESNLDHFEARYFNSSQARWLTPDWSADAQAAPYAKLNNPQSLNFYAYVFDNPLDAIDADGHEKKASPNGVTTDVTCEQGMAGEECHAWGDTVDGASAQNQSGEQIPSGQNAPEQKPPSSWKPGQPLPSDPTGLGPDWHKNPDHKNPNGEQWVNDKTGEKVEFERGRPGENGWKGEDHWHYTPPSGDRGKEHIRPGDLGKLLLTAGQGVVQTVREHPVATGVLVGTVALGATIATGGAAAPALAFVF